IRQPLPVDRREVPVEALVVVERKGRLLTFRGIERGEKVLRLRLHLPRDILERGAPGNGEAQTAACQQNDPRSHRASPVVLRSPSISQKNGVRHHFSEKRCQTPDRKSVV